jgi:tRNA (guanine9-N1)-methyltransferase
VASLTSQLAYTYSANRRSLTPFASLLFTSLDGRTKERLDAINDAGYNRWTNTQWWEEGYDRIWAPILDSHSGDDSNARRASVIYLTADSEEELMELKEDEIYVIGGICDHNRYKVCMCFQHTRDYKEHQFGGLHGKFEKMGPLFRALCSLASHNLIHRF